MAMGAPAMHVTVTEEATAQLRSQPQNLRLYPHESQRQGQGLALTSLTSHTYRAPSYSCGQQL